MANDAKILGQAIQAGVAKNTQPKKLTKSQRMAAEARSAMMQEARDRMTHLGAPPLKKTDG